MEADNFIVLCRLFYLPCGHTSLVLTRNVRCFYDKSYDSIILLSLWCYIEISIIVTSVLLWMWWHCCVSDTKCCQTAMDPLWDTYWTCTTWPLVVCHHLDHMVIYSRGKYSVCLSVCLSVYHYGPAVRYLLDLYNLTASSLSPSGPHGHLLKGQVLCLSVCLCACLSVCLSVCLSTTVDLLWDTYWTCTTWQLVVCHRLDQMVIYSRGQYSVCLSVCVSVCLSVCMYVCHSVCWCPSIQSWSLCVVGYCIRSVHSSEVPEVVNWSKWANLWLVGSVMNQFF